MHRHLHRTRSRFLAISLLIATALVACSSGSSDAKKATSPTDPPTSSQPAPTRDLRILVTNDDGYDAPGIDVVAQALSVLPSVEVTIVAPATNKSGTGSNTTPGTLTATDQQTTSGLPVTAVDGFPADAVRYALDTVMTELPDVVIAGINQGQNLGSVTSLSGTVGAAKAAAAREIPALSASQGLGAAPQYDVGAGLVVEWVTAHRDALVATTDSGDADLVGVVNLNIPTCASGSLRGVKQVPLAPDAVGALDGSNCGSTVTDVTTDIAAFLNGYAAVTQLDAAGATVTSSTTFPPVKSSG